jgi:hypothetical protein
VPPIVVPWPSSGQVQMRTTGMQPHQTVVYRMIWAQGQDPAKTGSVSVVEVPGCAVMHHHLQAWINGVLRWNGAEDDTGPQFGTCTAPTPGSPSTVQLVGGDTLDIYITNGDKPFLAPCCDILTDIRNPDRF